MSIFFFNSLKPLSTAYFGKVMKQVYLLKLVESWNKIYTSNCFPSFDFRDYCNFNSLKPLSTADFGKVMKQVYPQVRPRRLGTRGNSRYCYAGLKKRLKLEPPTTPECGGENGAHKLVKVNVDYEQEVDEATSFLIREWAGNLFNTKFACVKDLTLYLIDKIYVDNRSSAAHTILSSMSKAGGMNMILIFFVFYHNIFGYTNVVFAKGWLKFIYSEKATKILRKLHLTFDHSTHS